MRSMSWLVVMLAALLGAAPAFAVVTIDFATGTAGAGGTYTLNASGTEGTGSSIPIERITVSGCRQTTERSWSQEPVRIFRRPAPTVA
jgi:hypothetical protein